MPYRHDSKRTVVTGFALSFSPPKSVSLVGAFGDAETAAEVGAAHDSAVRAALSFLGDHAAFSRTGPRGPPRPDAGRRRPRRAGPVRPLRPPPGQRFMTTTRPSADGGGWGRASPDGIPAAGARTRWQRATCRPNVAKMSRSRQRWRT